jgi:hypothetical protein
MSRLAALLIFADHLERLEQAVAVRQVVGLVLDVVVAVSAMHEIFSVLTQKASQDRS